MKLRYNLSRAALIRGSLIYQAFNPTLWKSLKAYTIAFGLIFSFAGFLRTEGFNWESGRSIATFTILGTITLLCILGLIVVVGTFFEQLLSKKKGLIGKHELAILEQGLSESTEHNDTLHEWQNVKAVYETSGFFFIRVFESSYSVHIMPKDAPVSGGNLHDFITIIKARIKGAGDAADGNQR